MINALLVIALSGAFAVLLLSQTITQAHIHHLEIMSKRAADNCTSDLPPAPKLVRTMTCALPADVEPWNEDNFAEFAKLELRFNELWADLGMNRRRVCDLIPEVARSDAFASMLRDMDDAQDSLRAAIAGFRAVELEDIPGHLMKGEWDGDSFTDSDSEPEKEPEKEPKKEPKKEPERFMLASREDMLAILGKKA